MAVLSFLATAVVAMMVIGALFLLAVALVRLFLGLLLAVAGGGVIAAIASIWVVEQWPLVFLSVSVLLAFPAVAWMFRRPQVNSDIRPIADRSRPTILEPSIDHALTAAWQRAGELVPEFALRLMAARETCAALLQHAEANRLDMHLIEGAQIIRSHVPAVVAENEAAIARSSGEERNDAKRALVEDLEVIARIAKDRLCRSGVAGEEKLATLRAHLSARAAE